MDKPNWFVKHKVLTGVLVVFGLILILNAADNNKQVSTANEEPAEVTETTEVEEEIVEISPDDLLNKFSENEIAAIQKYRGKNIKVTGTIRHIGQTPLSANITINTANPFAGIQCLLKRSEKDKAAALRKDETITLIGTNPDKVINVVLKNCEIQ